MPYSLDGLNVVYANQPPTDGNDLLSGAPQSDLSLEIWDRLPFNLEDSHEQALSEEKHDMKKGAEDRAKEQGVFAGFEAGQQMWRHQSPQASGLSQNPFLPAINGNETLQLLLSTLLQQQQQQQQTAPQLPNLSIAQLLSQQQSMGMPPSFLSNPSVAPPPIVPASSSVGRSAPEDTPAGAAPPPSKRARLRKSSVSVSSPDSVDSPASPEASSTPMSAAEDKRRRNTAASARFRQKKKEREAALETRAKELQDQVNGLEKECETLRRENNWLKGLVVGVTGAGANQNGQSGTTN